MKLSLSSHNPKLLCRVRPSDPFSKAQVKLLSLRSALAS